MKKCWNFALLFFGLLAVLTGCQFSVPEVSLPSGWAGLTPEQAEAKITAQEAAFPQLRPQYAKTVTWAQPGRKVKTPVALVYLHGYAASHRELAPVPDRVAQSLGVNVFYTRFTAGGLGADAYKNIPLSAWENDAAEALAVGLTLGERVVLVAVSTGAPFAAWLAASSYNDKIAGLILVSPNFGPKDPLAELVLSPLGPWLVGLTQGEYRSYTPLNAQQEALWDVKTHSSSVVTMMQAVALGRAVPGELITAPVLVVNNLDDHLVNQQKTLEAVAKWASKTKVVAHLSGDPLWNHLLAGEAMNPQGNQPLQDLMENFLKTSVLKQ